MDEEAVALVDKRHHYKISIPVKAKLNYVSIMQLDGSKYDCPVLRANVKTHDSIYSSVNNMTAEICVINPDRNTNKITYRYENGVNKKPVTRKGDKKGNRLCFKVPLEYDKVHNFNIKQPDGTWKTYQIVLDRLPTNFVRIRLSFTCNNDVDLHVLEPVSNNGKKREIYFPLPNRKNFGELDIDSRTASEGPENYVLDLTNAPKGRYYYWVVWYSRLTHFKEYYNKSCYGKLEIVNQGRVTVKPISFLPVPYNKKQQELFSTYPSNKRDFYFDVK
jgi:hypothetical protein